MNTNPLIHFPGYLLRSVSNATLAKLKSDLDVHGVRLAQASLLVVISKNPGITAANASRLLSIRSANMAPLCTGLETDGLISRKPVDGKSRGIYLTDEGAVRAKKILKTMIAHERYLMDNIPEQLRAPFTEALNHLAQNT